MTAYIVISVGQCQGAPKQNDKAAETNMGKRGLFLFFLPPYSPHLNIAETLWRILKGKWIQPADYASADTLFYTVNRALAALGTTSKINFSMRV